MAKISKVVKNNKRKKMTAQYAERRAALKKIINNPNSSIEEVDAAQAKLQKIPRDASPVRVRNRCSQTGRPRGFAFVTMGSPEEAQKAIDAMNGKQLDGRPLTVNSARPREERPGGGGGGGRREFRGGGGGGGGGQRGGGGGRDRY